MASRRATCIRSLAMVVVRRESLIISSCCTASYVSSRRCSHQGGPHALGLGSAQRLRICHARARTDVLGILDHASAVRMFRRCIVTDIVYLYRCVCLPPPSVRMTSNCSLSEEVVPTEALSLNGVSESAVHRSSFPLFPVISKVA